MSLTPGPEAVARELANQDLSPVTDKARVRFRRLLRAAKALVRHHLVWVLGRESERLVQMVQGRAARAQSEALVPTEAACLAVETQGSAETGAPGLVNKGQDLVLHAAAVEVVVVADQETFQWPQYSQILCHSSQPLRSP